MNVNKTKETQMESTNVRFTSEYLNTAQSYPYYQNYSKLSSEKTHQDSSRPTYQTGKYSFHNTNLNQQSRTRNYYFDRKTNANLQTKYLKYQSHKSPQSKNNAQEQSTYQKNRYGERNFKNYQPFFGFKAQQPNQTQFKKAVSTGYTQSKQSKANSPYLDKGAQNRQIKNQEHYNKPQYLSYSNVGDSDSIQTLKKQLKNSLESYGALQHLLSKQQNQNIKLTQKISNLQSKQLQMQSTINSLQQKKTQYWKSLMNKESQYKSLQERINNLNNMSTLQQTQKQAILKKLQYSNVLFQQLEEESANQKTENKKIIQQNMELKRSLQNLKDNNEKLQHQKSLISQQLISKSKLIQQIQSKLNTAHEKNKTIQQSLKDVLTKYQGTTVSKAQLQIISSNYDQKILLLTKDKQSLYKSIMKLQLQHESLQETLKNKQKELQNYLQSKEKQHQQVEMEKKRLKSYEEIFSKEKEQFQQEKKKKILEMQQLQAVKTRQFFQQYMQEKQVIDKQNMALHVKLEEIKHQRQQFEKQTIEKDKLVKTLTLQVQQVSKQLSTEKQIVQKLKETIGNLQQQNKHKQMKFRQSFQADLRETQILKKKCSEQQLSIQKMTEQMQREAQKLNQMKENILLLNKQIQDKNQENNKKTQEIENIKAQYNEKMDSQLKQFQLQLKYFQIQDRTTTTDQKHEQLSHQLDLVKVNNIQLQQKLKEQGKHEQQLISQLEIGHKNYYQSINNFESCFNEKITINESKILLLEQNLKKHLKMMKSQAQREEILQLENSILTLQEQNCQLRKQVQSKIKSLMKLTEQKAELIKHFQSKSYEHSEKSQHQRAKKKLIRRDKAKLKMIKNQDGTQHFEQHPHKPTEEQLQSKQKQLYDKLEQKDYLISELKKSLQSYAEMVESLQYKNQDLMQALQQNDIIIEYYKDILDVFNIEWDEQTAQPPQEQLIMSINTFTKRIQSLMSSLNSLQEQLSKVTQQNSKIKSQQQAILKKCQFMISTAEKENDQLVAKCSKLYHKLGMADEHIAVLQRLVWQYNEQITVLKLKLLNVTLAHKNKEKEQQYEVVSREDLEQSQSQKYSEKRQIQNCEVDQQQNQQITVLIKQKLGVVQGLNQVDNTETLHPLSPATFADKNSLKKSSLEVRSPRSRTTKVQKKQSKKSVRK